MKTRLKEQFLEKRNQLSKEEILEMSKKIQENLEKLPQYENARTVMQFVSFGTEVDTHQIIKDAIKSKTVAVPKTVEHKIEPCILIDFDSMSPTDPFGILEPMDLMKLSYKSIEVVIVPGIVFDTQGHRIGYGMGFYDAFLKHVPNAVKIGLCFDFQVVDLVPREDHDVPVDFIVTEKRVIECGKSK